MGSENFGGLPPEYFYDPNAAAMYGYSFPYATDGTMADGTASLYNAQGTDSYYAGSTSSEGSSTASGVETYNFGTSAQMTSAKSLALARRPVKVGPSFFDQFSDISSLETAGSTSTTPQVHIPAHALPAGTVTETAPSSGPELDSDLSPSQIPPSYWPEDENQPIGPDPEPPIFSSLVWVGNICASISDQELRSYFDSCGTVLQFQRYPKRSCASVKFATNTEALNALRFDNMRLGMSEISIRVAKATRILWIGNLSGTTNADLFKWFSVFGSVDSVQINPRQNSGFVKFNQLYDAIRCRDKMDGTVIGSGKVTINFVWPKMRKDKKIGLTGDGKEMDGSLEKQAEV